jgi:anti-sigma regulatory factor (Ser/Thr protein kinase)
MPAPPRPGAHTRLQNQDAADGATKLRSWVAGCPADALPSAVDELTLTVERECLSGGEVPGTTGVWVGRLRKIAGARLRLWSLSALVDDAQLLISELVTNAFRHGTSSQVTFRLVIGAGSVMVEVDDGSAGRPQVRQAGPDAVSGRGLFLVNALAAAWGVSADGACTWCVLDVPNAAEGRR